MHLPLVPLPRLVEPTSETFRLAPDTALRRAPRDVAILLRARTRLPLTGGAQGAVDFRLVPGGAAESYRLAVTASGVRIEAADPAGLSHAGRTLAQLLARDADGWWLPGVLIEDAPRFGYRAAMLDVARHFFDVATVKTFIDRIADLKLNVLHLHLSDDQGWRLEVAARPGLTLRAAGSCVGGGPGGHYTQDDYAELVRHATARHVTIVPEIDLPGHTHAVGVAYPDLAERPVLNRRTLATILGTDRVMPRAGRPFTGMGVGFSSLRLDHEPSYDFVADVLTELAALTPGPYLHIGGDECLGTRPEAFAGFLRRVTALVAGLGKTPIAWHEAGAVAGVAPGTVGQYWGFLVPDRAATRCARQLVAQGSPLVLSPADATYLDMKAERNGPGRDWIGGSITLERSYRWEPAEVVPGADEACILGVEAPLWTEQVATSAEIDALVFPRLAAIAEIGWSAPAGTPGRTWPEFRRRLAGLAPGWRADGVGFTALPEVDWVDGTPG